MQYQRFETKMADGSVRYGVQAIADCSECYGDGDIGSSPVATITAFLTAGEREYYLQARGYEDRLKTAIRELEWIKSDIQKILTPKGRIRRRRVLELVAKNK